MGRGRLLLTLTMGPVIALAVAQTAPQAGASSMVRHRAAARTSTGGIGRNSPFCKQLGKHYQASSGAQMYCFGAQLHKGTNAPPAISAGPGAPRNVDAARVSEDVNPAGVPAQGQSEVSVAAAGRYAVEAWNDATGFLTGCGAPSFKEELTGLGFSVNGGKSFTDLGGLPNLNCKKDLYEGDPSVAAYRVGGHDYFYISSLYDPVNGEGPTFIAFDACTVRGSGSAASLDCGQPIIAGSSTQCLLFKERIGPHKTRTVEFCSFTDKDFLAIDPAHGKLYVTYSDFQVSGRGVDPEVMSACDIGNAAGGAGPAGGTPAAPVCEHGTKLTKVSKNMLRAKPYFTVAKADPRGCENEGAYPAVDTGTGTAYVGYEFNWFSSVFGPCVTASTPVENVVAKVPPRCLTLTPTSPCAKPSRTVSVPVVSLEADFVPGYNRFPVNDFPRLAVSDRFKTVSMVWNDTRLHPFGDIMLQSFSRALHPIQSKPVVLDRPHRGGLSMLPGLRTASGGGLLDVSWYSRASVSTADTSVMAAMNLSPLVKATPPNRLITSALSNWDNNSSLIVPNFGDYTDSAVSVTGSAPYVGHTWFVAWSDGRLGIPQPFEANLPAR